MRAWLKGTGVAIAAGLALTGAVGTTTASAADKPVIYPVSKEYAPKGRKGAVILPFTTPCLSRATIQRIGTKQTITRSYRIGLRYVWVSAGRYRVTIKRTCDGVTATKTSTVTVRKEKDGNTIDRAEFNRIKKGMTLAQVKKVVGTAGIGNSVDRYFDRRGSNSRWAEVWFSRGRVAGKGWDAPLADSGVR